MDLSSESCEEGGLSLLGNKDEPIFREYVLPDQPEFLVIFYKLLELRFATNWPYLKCTSGNYCNKRKEMLTINSL